MSLTLEPRRALNTYLKKLMQIPPPIAYSLDYQMTERFDSGTIANHPKNGIIKMERARRRRGEEGEEVMFS